MSKMSWLFPKKKRAPAATAVPAGLSASRTGSQKDGAASSSAASARRKADRGARRELLYTVVRETMVRAGVLTASYKFKVLSLDGDGRQFLIMIDLARGVGGDAKQLAEIEALIAQSAKSRHELLVTAVYWRLTEQMSVGLSGLAVADPAGHSEPFARDSQPVPLHAGPEPRATGAPSGPAFDPIEQDEVEAFRKALVAGSTGPVPLAPTPASTRARGEAAIGRSGLRSYTLLTGYEDTELPESDQKAPLLSGSQYGDLR